MSAEYLVEIEHPRFGWIQLRDAFIDLNEAIACCETSAYDARVIRIEPQTSTGVLEHVYRKQQ